MKRLRWHPFAVLTLVVALLFPGEARADSTFDTDVLVLIAVAALLLPASHAPFAVYDAVVAAQDELPSTGWAIAETAITGPPILMLYGFAGYFKFKRDDHHDWIDTAMFGVFTVQPTHGILSLAQDRLSPGTLYGMSAATGMNVALSFDALTTALGRRSLSSRNIGIFQMVATAPQVGIFSYAAAIRADLRPLWIGYAAWSGALFLHGLASTIWGATGRDADKTSAFSPQNAPLRSLSLQGGLVPIQDSLRGHGMLFTLNGLF